MKDVATYCRWKLALNAVPQLLFGLIGLGAGLILIPHIILEEVRRLHSSYGPLVVCLIPTAVGVMFFSGGVRRLREAFEDDCWLRAGPEGIAWRLPGWPRWKTLWCAYDMNERRVAWKDVAQLQLHETRLNGVIPFGTDLVVVTGGRGLKLESVYFRESAAHIREAIKIAAPR
jgi:hypothetical protein